MKNLNKQQIRYIDENTGKAPAEKIAKHLGVDKRLVIEYLKKTHKDNSKAVGPSRKSTAIHITIIFVIAIIARLVYIQQLSHTYFFAPFKGGFDDYIFDNWAQQILKGNWIGDPVIFIYRMPLYVYFLTAVYFFAGHSYWTVYILHALIGTATCILIYAIGRMLFSRNTGLIAALMAALYGPFLFFGGMVVGETLAVFLTCLSFLFLLFFQRTENAIHALLGGVFIGFSMLLRGSMLFALPLLVIWAAVFFKTATLFKKFLYATAILAGVATAVSPVIVRNYIYAKDFVPITASGGLNIYIGNAQGADGKYRVVERLGGNAEQMFKSSIEVAEKAAGKKLKPSEVSNYWAKEAFASIRAKGIPAFAGLTGRKFVMFWNSYEFPDIWDYYFFKRYIPILNMPLFGLIFIVPLAAAGLYFSWPDRRRLAPLYIFIFASMASLIVFFISSRYRLVVVPFLIVLAAYAVNEIWYRIKEGRKGLVIAGAIIAGAGVFTCIPVEKVNFETSYNSLGIMLKRSGKTDEAMKAYSKAIEIAPNYPTPYYNIGVLYRDRGDIGAAAAYFKKAVELAPDFVEARRELERLRPR